MNYKEKIKALGVSNKYFAKKLGVSTVMFSYYMTGTHDIPEDKKKRLDSLINQIEQIK